MNTKPFMDLKSFTVGLVAALAGSLVGFLYPLSTPQWSKTGDLQRTALDSRPRQPEVALAYSQRELPAAMQADRPVGKYTNRLSPLQQMLEDKRLLELGKQRRLFGSDRRSLNNNFSRELGLTDNEIEKIQGTLAAAHADLSIALAQNSRIESKEPNSVIIIVNAFDTNGIYERAMAEVQQTLSAENYETFETLGGPELRAQLTSRNTGRRTISVSLHDGMYSVREQPDLPPNGTGRIVSSSRTMTRDEFVERYEGIAHLFLGALTTY